MERCYISLTMAAIKGDANILFRIWYDWLKVTIHYATFRASFDSSHLPQPISCRNGLFRQLNKVFRQLNILCRVARIKIISLFDVWSAVNKSYSPVAQMFLMLHDAQNTLTQNPVATGGQNNHLYWKKVALTDCSYGRQCLCVYINTKNIKKNTSILTPHVHFCHDKLRSSKL